MTQGNGYYTMLNFKNLDLKLRKYLSTSSGYFGGSYDCLCPINSIFSKVVACTQLTTIIKHYF